MIWPCNANSAPPDGRDFEVARAAGGLSIAELRRQHGAVDLNDTHYLDEHTDLWIPHGVLLFRPWRRRQPVRDTMQLEG